MCAGLVGTSARVCCTCGTGRKGWPHCRKGKPGALLLPSPIPLHPRPSAMQPEVGCRHGHSPRGRISPNGAKKCIQSTSQCVLEEGQQGEWMFTIHWRREISVENDMYGNSGVRGSNLEKMKKCDQKKDGESGQRQEGHPGRPPEL